MAGAIGLGDFRIVLGALVDIVDVERDRRAGRAPLEHAREDAGLVRLLALGGEARLAGAALVEERLDITLGQGQPRRAAVHDRAQRRAVALAPGGEAEDASEGVEAHYSPPSCANAGACVAAPRTPHGMAPPCSGSAIR